MRFDDEFRRHLHDVMVEASLGLRDELNQHQREVVWKARQTHNAAALPNAYSAAAIYAFRTRVETIVTRYMAALGNCGIEVDEVVEKEMLGIIGALTSARHPLSFPPAMKGPQLAAVQRAHMMELERVGQLLYRKAANQLREAKIKVRKESQINHPASPMPHSKPFSLASSAKTLAEVKALPTIDQDMLLLEKLAHVYPQMRSSGGLHKGNLLLPDDGYGLGTGLSPADNMPIRQYLLGAPWTRLVNAGFLVDPSGSGFFSVSDEGLAAITSARATRTAITSTNQNPEPRRAMQPKKAISVLKKLVEEARLLPGEPFASPRRSQWKDTARGALEQSAVSDSLVQSFDASQSMVFVSGTSEEDMRKMSNSNLAGMTAVLNSAIEQLGWQIEERWDDPTIATEGTATQGPVKSTASTFDVGDGNLLYVNGEVWRDTKVDDETPLRRGTFYSSSLAKVAQLSFEDMAGYFDEIEISLPDAQKDLQNWDFAYIEVDLTELQDRRVEVDFRLEYDLEFWAKQYSIADLATALAKVLARHSTPFAYWQRDKNTAINGFGVQSRCPWITTFKRPSTNTES
jgi:hypothetical protein